MIVVFGSINVDLSIRTPALPRPGETVLAPSLRQLAGGKGANQALAAVLAGAKVAMYGCVGRDAFAETALAGLRAAGVGLDGVAAADDSTGCATVCVAPGGENQIVVASGANLRVRADQVPDDVLGPATTLLLQQEVPAAENLSLAVRARRAGATIVLNAAPAREVSEDVLRSVDVLVVNEIEAAMTAQALGLSAGEPAGAARSVSDALAAAVVLTLGGEGVQAFGPEGAWTVGALPIEPVDTTGAGDVFCGYLAAALDRGQALAEALRRASVAAGLACLTQGAQEGVPAAEAVNARLAELAPAHPLP